MSRNKREGHYIGYTWKKYRWDCDVFVKGHRRSHGDYEPLKRNYWYPIELLEEGMP